MSQKQDLPLIPLIHHWVFFAPACAVLQRSEPVMNVSEWFDLSIYEHCLYVFVSCPSAQTSSCDCFSPFQISMASLARFAPKSS